MKQRLLRLIRYAAECYGSTPKQRLRRTTRKNYNESRPMKNQFAKITSQIFLLKEAAKYLGLSRARVHILYQSGRIVGETRPGVILLSRKSVEEFASNKRGAK